MTPKEAKKKISDIMFKFLNDENVTGDETNKKIMNILDKIES